MLKTLLVLSGMLVVSATGLQAQVHESAFAARPSAYRGASGRAAGYAYTNHHHGGYYGRYYYLGGVPFFYPYDYFGFGYPYYDGFGGAYGYGGYPGGDGAYNGRVADGGNGTGNGGQGSGASLPEAVQRQLAKRGYYKGTVDGEFGPASRDALTRFQKKQGLKETGKIDEPTLEALGFTDHR